MRALEAEAVVLHRLAEVGVAIEHRADFRIGAGADVPKALDAFFNFAAEPIDESDDRYGTPCTVDRFNDGDLLLFETGAGPVLPPPERPFWSLSDEPVPQMYELSLTRQLSFYDTDGEYQGMHAATLTVQTALTSSLQYLAQEQIWGTAGLAWTADELVEHGQDPGAPPPTGAAAWRQQVTATSAFSEALADPTLFYIVQSDI